MKKFFPLLFLLPVFAFFALTSVSLAFDIPEKPQNFVNDYAEILSPENKNLLESKILNFEKKTSNEIAVVIISSLDGDTIENVAQDIFTKWGIGKVDQNNGVLFLVAIEERKTRIHTGYGVEGMLTDLATSYIQSEIVASNFRMGDYYAGINGAVDEMIHALDGDSIVPEGYSTENKSGVNIEYFFIIGFFILQWVIAILRRSKSWWGGGVLGAIVGGVIWFLGLFSLIASVFLFIFLIAFGLGLDFLVSRAYQKAKNSGGHYPWWIGGGGFGGGHGGGFGGFGGGLSGGGGSSGNW